MLVRGFDSLVLSELAAGYSSSIILGCFFCFVVIVSFFFFHLCYFFLSVCTCVCIFAWENFVLVVFYVLFPLETFLMKCGEPMSSLLCSKKNKKSKFTLYVCACACFSSLLLVVLDLGL